MSPIQKQLPTDVGSSEAGETTPRKQLSPWKRADKAFGFGFFVGVASTYGVQSDISSSDRMLLAGILGVVAGLATYLIAVGYYAAKEDRSPVAQSPEASRQRPEEQQRPTVKVIKRNARLILYMLLAIFFGLLTLFFGFAGLCLLFSGTDEPPVYGAIPLIFAFLFGLAAYYCRKKMQ